MLMKNKNSIFFVIFMKKLYLALPVLCLGAYQIFANNITTTNLTSAQAEVTLQTPTETITISVLPYSHESREVGTKTDQTILNYDSQPIQKISITRATTPFPQIIYYDTQDSSNGGINKVNETGQGSMNLTEEGIELSGQLYKIFDFSSYIEHIKKLQTQLSMQTIDTTQKEITQLSHQLNLIKSSNRAQELKLEISVIEKELQELVKSIEIMQQLNETTQVINNLEHQLAPDNLESVEQSLDSMQNQLNSIASANFDESVTAEIDNVQTNLDFLSNQIDRMSAD